MFNLELTAHLAELSKLEFSQDELLNMASQMGDIVAVMDKVKAVDPGERVYASEAVNYESLRTDEVKASLEPEDILKNAQKKKNNSFVVPKVV